MKKTSLALACLSALTVPMAAHADVEIGPFAAYGQLNSALETIKVDSEATLAKTKDSQTRLMDQSSRLGFKFKHDMGDGWTALGQVESRIYLGNAGDNSDDKAELGSRNTFVGLSGKSVGTLRLGRYDNAYKHSLRAAVPTIYNNLNDASAEYGSKQILNRLGGRQGDMIAYESPKFAGLTALLTYNLGKDSSGSISAGSAANTVKYTAATDFMPQLALGLGWQIEGLNVGLGYTTLSRASWQLSASSGAKAANNAGASQDLSALQLGAEYKLGDFSLGAVVERTASKSVAKSYDEKQTTYGLVGGWKSGAMTAQLHYAQANDVSGTATKDTGARQIAAVFAYQLHKNLSAITTLTQVKNEKNSSFTSGSGFALDAGNDMTQLALGLMASF